MFYRYKVKFYDEVNNINADNNYGDIKIKNVYNYINLNCDCGDIKINNAALNKNSVIKDDYGDITISNIKTEFFLSIYTSLWIYMLNCYILYLS